MKKIYNVYGIGNALVDLETRVTDEFLERNQVKKGWMTLVDEATQTQLLAAIDQEEAKQKPGGSAANTMMAIGQLGGKAFYSCKVANDTHGDFYLADMHAAGIDTNFDRQEQEGGITGKCLVMITDDASRTMNTFLGITATLSTSEVDEQAIREAEYVYIEGYLVASDTGYEAMKLTKELAKANGTKTTLTLSDPSIVEGFKDRFDEIIGDSIDLLFCNEEEAQKYTGKEEKTEVRAALKKKAHRFVITHGAEGVTIYDGSRFIEIEGHPVKAVDTNGAGDMFAGAFLYGITHGMSNQEAGKLANLAGAKVVAQYGPRLQVHQIQELLAEI